MNWRHIESAPHDLRVLVTRDGTPVRIAFFERGRWLDDGECREIATPTHWMPLPELPTDEEDERERVYRLFGQLRRGEP